MSTPFSIIACGSRAVGSMLVMMFSMASFAQLAPVTPPSGGFRIEGDLISGTPSIGEGDWVAGSTGGYVFYHNGTAVDPSRSSLVKDPFHSSADDVFSGSSFSQNPNSWRWTTASAANKTDINNGMYHITSAGSQKWVIMGGDRESNTGTSYIDFEFYQGYLTKNNNGTFTSLSSTSTSLASSNGRTPGDFVLSMEYTNGGAIAAVHFYRWELSGGTYRYVEYDLPASSSGSLAFGATNPLSVNVPFGAFGSTTYQPYLFVEAAVDVDAILNAVDPCAQISIKTVFIKTKASDSYNAALKDFIAPIPVNFTFGNESFSYPDGPYYTCGTLTPSFTGSGTFSASPSTGLSIDPATGVIQLGSSTPGTYVITYQYDAGGGCNMPTTDTINIMALPAPSSVSNQVLCSESPTNAVSFSSSLSPVSFSWTNDQTSIGLAASGSGNMASFTAMNTGSGSVTATVTYTPHYTAGGDICAGPAGTFTIVVHPLPAKPQVSLTEPSICGSSTGIISVQSPAGTGYQYSNNGGDWQSGTSFSNIAAGAGYHILVKDEHGCISSTAAGCEEETMIPSEKKEVNSVKAPITSAVETESKDTDFSSLHTESISIRSYPNPFSSKVEFDIITKESGVGRLDIFTIMGQKVKTVYQGHLPAGRHHFTANIPMDIHQLIYVLQVGHERKSGRLMKE